MVAVVIYLDVDETTSTLLEFDIVDLDKPVRKELLESIKREGVVLYQKFEKDIGISKGDEQA